LGYPGYRFKFGQSGGKQKIIISGLEGKENKRRKAMGNSGAGRKKSTTYT